MKKARYICLEGVEGVGKTTQAQKLTQFLIQQNYSVLHTREPGTAHIPITMMLRAIMLDNTYDECLTKESRELISQAIRSIHVEKLILPALREYDFVVQDRGALSGLSYGAACGNSIIDLINLSDFICKDKTSIHSLYDDILILKGNVSSGLNRALSSKKEFENGDAMESLGEEFLHLVSKNMDKFSIFFKNCHVVNVENKDIDTVFNEIKYSLGI